MASLDLRPFLSDVSSDDVSKFVDGGLSSRESSMKPIVLIPLMILVFAVIGRFFYAVISQLLSVAVAWVVFCSLVIVGAAIGWYYSVYVVKSQYVPTIRLKRTAELNGYQFDAELAHAKDNSILFDDREVVLRNVITGTYNTVGFRIANAEAIADVVSTTPVLNWNVMRIKLQQDFPHLVLDSTSNNSLFSSSVPVTFKRQQALSLEGDFNRHFTMYAPNEFKRDIYYIFTPDVMAFFIDRLSECDIEIKGSFMYVYTPRVIEYSSPETFEALLTLLFDTIDKIDRASTRYQNSTASTATLHEGLNTRLF